MTQAEAAALMGRTPTFLTRIYSGAQELKISEAEELAEILNSSRDEVLARAGLALPDMAPPSMPPGFHAARRVQPQGFANDAAPWVPQLDDRERERVEDMASHLIKGHGGRHIWQVKNRVMILDGFAEGDFMLVDQHMEPKSGDAVIAQVYDWNRGTATTVLRRFDPPVLIAASANPSEWKPLSIESVKIMGVVTASWRVRAAPAE